MSGRQSLPTDSFSANNSFVDQDSQMMDRDGNEDGDSVLGVGGPSKASRSSANNEVEMRHLFRQNQHRSLVDVAEELHGNERGPNSERTRQVFAMLWINSVCSKGKGSVPRGRVYANYASRCATERITVLNPASFGKLVRVLFPGLKTRRLGVRGESKYHYVNFTLMEDEPDLREPPRSLTVPLAEGTSLVPTFNASSGTATTTARPQKTAFPSPDLAQNTDNQPTRSREFTHSLYNQPDVSSIDQFHSTMNKTLQKLDWAPESEDPFQQSEPIILPSIEPFLPSGTDPDAAKSLTALYRSHCTSLVECVRYCKEKTFFHLFTSFQGTLTMPVQKLFGNPAIAAWIEECDFILYHRMMRIVSALTLQVVPKPVLDTLRNISERLVPHIRDSFQGQPHHVVRAKEAPATLFAGLIDRALRVNLTAHAAANMLSNPANRDEMYLDWITMVRTRKVAECVPDKAMDDVVNLLLTELRGLLDPVDVPWEIECLTLYGDMALRNGRPQQSDTSGNLGTQNVLDRWVNFLRSLPTRFPYASPAEIVLFVQRLGTNVMRDITISQGKSFGSWWVTKCWVDEMISFLAEQGGFMKQKTTQTALDIGKRQASTREVSCQGSRYSSGSDDFSMPRMGQAQPDRAPFPTAPAPSTHDTLALNAANHDDSGIGIRTPEEEFPMDKFTFPQDGHELLDGVDLHNGMTS
ncbi:putative rfx dna-binding domain-containing protein [Phaeoacremonium minimum UCRPA7]|uniref:Putative rfx dna-binding domain-containing protein n=1 Tax=Phaeoacremonium minimum (strain UCR-PA7) TaxID=1286976 RepID=R8BUB4_PHAM7|nr:putative rfx dna-binding domain-containing protein [Phaeoacremonium minimum UCRPA7]EOO02983.1 putative rfx dna-binding domain-containing protein [Phaeoacremonium minimum UCRPA7]